MARAHLIAPLVTGLVALAACGCGAGASSSDLAVPVSTVAARALDALANAPPATTASRASGRSSPMYPRLTREDRQARPATPRGGATITPACSPPPSRAKPPFAVGERILTFVDHTRWVRFPGRPRQPRTLTTVIRYPAQGSPTLTDVSNAKPLSCAGPFPLVVFGHGFAVTPAYYARLLRAWARAGYVVAAPVFPLGNQNAPGGPDESDIVNQPRDMSLVITRLLAASADPHALLAGLIDPQAIAVSGQSDGGETALTVTYNRSYLDRRIDAAIILSGAAAPGAVFAFPTPSPPLLASQGTADTINLPKNTYQFFDLAPRPKYLLKLLGALHLPPYTYQQPQLGIVERVSIAFLDRYLKRVRGALGRMLAAGRVAGVSSIATHS